MSFHSRSSIILSGNFEFFNSGKVFLTWNKHFNINDLAMVNLKGRGLKGLLALFIKVLHCWVQLNYATGYYLTYPHANARGGSLMIHCFCWRILWFLSLSLSLPTLSLFISVVLGWVSKAKEKESKGLALTPLHKGKEGGAVLKKYWTWLVQSWNKIFIFPFPHFLGLGGKQNPRIKKWVAP